MTRPSRETPAGQAYLDLQRLGGRENRPTDELLALFALEGFLDRLSMSPRAGDLVLKGGVLLAVYDARRPTRDVDLQANALGNDTATVLGLVRGIASIAIDDGLVYEGAAATAEIIRDGDENPGVRVSMSCGLATARLVFHVDVNIADPVSPPAQQVLLPRLLGGTISLLGYPLAMVYAEKIVTAMQRGTLNTRWRDFADLYLLSGRHYADGAELELSLRIVAQHRSASLIQLSAVLDGYAGLAQARWAAWVRKQRLDDRLPLQFDAVLTSVVSFADPPLLGDAGGRTWQPTSGKWIPTESVSE
jgi:Nucleotidyl transferase AbiEii toxin, Type IV TA system